MWIYNRVLHPKDADRMANSVDPDQTAPGAVRSGSTLVTVCTDLSVRKLRIITVCDNLGIIFHFSEWCLYSVYIYHVYVL